MNYLEEENEDEQEWRGMRWDNEGQLGYKQLMKLQQ